MSDRFKILLIEDNLVIQHIHHHMLTKLDCVVDMTDAGLTAIKMASENSDYRIIFVDIGLPDISGFDVIKSIIAMPHCKNTAVIALTAYVAKEETEACQTAGAVKVLYKPVTLELMRNVLAEYRL